MGGETARRGRLALDQGRPGREARPGYRNSGAYGSPGNDPVGGARQASRSAAAPLPRAGPAAPCSSRGPRLLGAYLQPATRSTTVPKPTRGRPSAGRRSKRWLAELWVASGLMRPGEITEVDRGPPGRAHDMGEAAWTSGRDPYLSTGAQPSVVAAPFEERPGRAPRPRPSAYYRTRSIARCRTELETDRKSDRLYGEDVRQRGGILRGCVAVLQKDFGADRVFFSTPLSRKTAILGSAVGAALKRVEAHRGDHVGGLSVRPLRPV